MDHGRNKRASRARHSSQTFLDEQNARSLSMLLWEGGLLRYRQGAATRPGNPLAFTVHHCYGSLLDSSMESRTCADISPETEYASLTSESSVVKSEMWSHVLPAVITGLVD